MSAPPPPVPVPPRRFRRLTVAIVCFTTLLLLTVWWMGPAPPRVIVIATGEPDGVYHDLGLEYKKRLEKMGITVQLVSTQGSMDNLHLLLDRKVDLALVQAGTGSLVEQQDAEEVLRGVAAVQLEPVWVFYRGEVKENIARLLQGEKNKQIGGRQLSVAVGQESSGTATVAQDLLGVNGIEKSDAEVLHLSMTEAAKRLKNGTLDVSFFVSSPRNKTVRDLMLNASTEPNPDKQIHLLNVTRQLAYSQRFPYLSTVTLGQGVLNLEKDIPDTDVNMLATSTLLVCRDDLHPQAVEQILIAADHVHAREGFIPTTHNFPTDTGVDLPIHTAAKAHLQSGQSFLTRLLPYWGVWLLFKVQLVIIPLVLVWLPLFKILPLAWRFRINRLLSKHYKALRVIEDEIENAERPEIVEAQIAELDSLRQNMESLSRKVPTHLQINVYQWRLHVSHVRAEAVERLWHLRSPKNGPGATSGEPQNGGSSAPGVAPTQD